ncbi:MAG: YihY/virulence factor BrkB family protein [Bryobacteraceae bacterium]
MPQSSGRVKPASWLRALARVPMGLYRHGALGYAKGAAYSALLSFFPVFAVTIAALFEAHEAEVARRIARLLYEFSPPEVEQLLRSWFTERIRHPQSLRAVAVLLSLWAASGVMATLIEAFQETYERRDTRGAVRQRVLEIALVLMSLLPAVGATALILLGDNAENEVLRWLGVLGTGEILRPGVLLVGRLVRYAVALSTVWLVTAMLYWLGPDVKSRRKLLPGAFLATILWLALTQSFAWYVRNFGNYNVLYGSVGAVIAFLVWMYLLALVAMIGCEFNAALDRGAGKS